MLPLILHQHKSISQSFFLIILKHLGEKTEFEKFFAEETFLPGSAGHAGVYTHGSHKPDC